MLHSLLGENICQYVERFVNFVDFFKIGNYLANEDVGLLRKLEY
jgi:hypothetical protein